MSALFIMTHKLETTIMSINRRMDKEIVVYPYKEMLHRSKKSKLLHAKTWINYVHVIMMYERSYSQYIMIVFI